MSTRAEKIALLNAADAAGEGDPWAGKTDPSGVTHPMSNAQRTRQEKISLLIDHHKAVIEADRLKVSPANNDVKDYLADLAGGVYTGARGLVTTMGRLARAARGREIPGTEGSDLGAGATEEIRQRDQPLHDMPMGGVVNAVGESLPLAATIPISGGVSAATRGMSALPRVLGRAAAAGTEGAIQGNALSSPDDDATGISGGLGTVLGLLGSAGGRTARGIVRKTPEAHSLIKSVEGAGGKLELPLVNAAQDDGLSGMFKVLYQHGLPNLPLASGALRKQSEEAAQTIRTALAKETTPPGYKGTVDLSGDAADQMDHLRDSFNQHFNDILNSYAFTVPKDLQERIKKRLIDSISPTDLAAGNTIPELIQDKLSALIEGSVATMSDGKRVIGGRNLMTAKNLANEQFDKLTVAERPHMSAATKSIDDIITEGLPAAEAKKFTDTQAVYPRLNSLERAVAAAKTNKGEYTFSDLMKAAGNDPELEHVAKAGIESFDKNKLNPTWLGRMQLGGVPLAGGLLALTAAGPAGLITATGGGRLLASKAMQRTLMGDTAIQKKIAALLKKHPDRTAALGAFLREGAVVGENDASR